MYSASAYDVVVLAIDQFSCFHMLHRQYLTTHNLLALQLELGRPSWVSLSAAVLSRMSAMYQLPNCRHRRLECQQAQAAQRRRFQLQQVHAARQQPGLKVRLPHVYPGKPWLMWTLLCSEHVSGVAFACSTACARSTRTGGTHAQRRPTPCQTAEHVPAATSCANVRRR